MLILINPSAIYQESHSLSLLDGNTTKCRKKICSLTYLAAKTRTDTVAASSRLGSRVTMPTQADIFLSKGVLRYLLGTRNASITLLSSFSQEMQPYIDSGCEIYYEVERHSPDGILIMYGKCSNQRHEQGEKVAIFTTEAVYIGLSEEYKAHCKALKIINRTKPALQPYIYPSEQYKLDEMGEGRYPTAIKSMET